MSGSGRAQEVTEFDKTLSWCGRLVQSDSVWLMMWCELMVRDLVEHDLMVHDLLEHDQMEHDLLEQDLMMQEPAYLIVAEVIVSGEVGW